MGYEITRVFLTEIIAGLTAKPLLQLAVRKAVRAAVVSVRSLLGFCIFWLQQCKESAQESFDSTLSTKRQAGTWWVGRGPDPTVTIRKYVWGRAAADIEQRAREM